MLTIKDEYGNSASVSFWGSEEKARESLKTLTNCTNCVDCLRCTDCMNCMRCTDCTDPELHGSLGQYGWWVKSGECAVGCYAFPAEKWLEMSLDELYGLSDDAEDWCKKYLSLWIHIVEESI